MRRNDVTPLVRQALADIIGDGLEALDPPLPDALVPEVRAVSRKLTGDLPSPLVHVFLQRMEPGETGGTRRKHTLFVDVVSDHQADPDDGLDELASAVLDVLTACQCTYWTTAERAVVDDLYPAYRITLTMEDNS